MNAREIVFVLSYGINKPNRNILDLSVAKIIIELWFGTPDMYQIVCS